MALHIGTSGWHYPHWSGPFYPPDLPKKEYLRFYADRFESVEINNSFYRLPQKDTLLSWRETTGPGFVFAVKASRFITHMKKLKDPEKSFRPFFERIGKLGKKLGPVLFQLPPKWNCDPERLERFLDALPGSLRYAFEFRDASWFTPRIYELLSAHGAAFCIFELAGARSPVLVTGPFAYVRLHGPGSAYQGAYGKAGLVEWADAVSAWRKEGRDVFFYFDNDEAGYAASDALELKRMMEGEAA
jgi:uncharacterized protein YecE (DUF72 family)